jgi:3-hydroxybutyryl-CoA dehydrogenase
MSSDRPAISRVLVVGYGVMGRGIAKSFAEAGFATEVLSRRAAEIRDAPPGVSIVARLPETAPDLVIESVPEVAEVKRQAYAAIEAAYGGAAIIATNTSGLPLPELERDLAHPEHFCGTHYFMPADTSAVVEVMAGTRTDPAALDAVADAMRRTGKHVVVLRRPIVGYLVNRLQHALLHEAYHLLSSGVATVDEIDQAGRLMLGPRMCINGIIEQKDIGGLEIHARAQQSIVPTLEHTGVPNWYLQDLVNRGEVGLGAGLGFYDWRRCDAPAVLRDTGARLKALMTFLRSLGPRATGTTPEPRAVETPKR